MNGVAAVAAAEPIFVMKRQVLMKIESNLMEYDGVENCLQPL